MPNAPTSTKPLSNQWYALNCDCGFTAKSHNRSEMEEIGGLHAKRSHPDMKFTPEQARALVKAV